MKHSFLTAFSERFASCVSLLYTVRFSSSAHSFRKSVFILLFSLAGISVFFTSASAAEPENTENVNAGNMNTELKNTESANVEPVLIINEDNDHYFKQTSDLMTREALEAYIDRMKGSHVTHFYMCPQGQRTSYKSGVHEAVWEGMQDGKPVNYGSGEEGIRWASNCKKLYDAGIDPYSVWIERCRKDGISPWISMRMNDVHFVSTENYFRNFNFWREHPELWRVPDCKTGNWTDCAFNYAKKEARDFYMACAKELLERYDTDGFEMDWMRFCLHLTPGHEAEEAHFLTEFVREVRKTARALEEKRGHKILISVRVPAVPEGSAQLGMNAVEWAREGIIDQIVASCFFSSSDFNISANDWKKAIGNPDFPIYAGTDDGVSCGNGVSRTSLTYEMYNGWANNMYSNGSDGLYLFNLVYRPAMFEHIIARGYAPAEVRNAHRRHVVSYRDYLANYPGLEKEMQLPKTLTAESPVNIGVQFGKKPEKAGTLTVVAGFREAEGLADAVISAALNGTEAEAGKVQEFPDAVRLGGMKRALRFEFPLAAACDGMNTVTLTLKEGKTQQAGWVEMEYIPE